MEPYVKKSVLVAEIERLIDSNKSLKTLDPTYYEGLVDSLNDVLSFLNTLEVKDVDLESEITLWANAIPEIRLDDVERLATYFFELGIKTQKGE